MWPVLSLFPQLHQQLNRPELTLKPFSSFRTTSFELHTTNSPAKCRKRQTDTAPTAATAAMETPMTWKTEPHSCSLPSPWARAIQVSVPLHPRHLLLHHTAGAAACASCIQIQANCTFGRTEGCTSASYGKSGAHSLAEPFLQALRASWL